MAVKATVVFELNDDVQNIDSNLRAIGATRVADLQVISEEEAAEFGETLGPKPAEPESDVVVPVEKNED